MDATAFATVYLDRDLCITGFTPAAVSLFNLIATDLGRPLTDLETHLHYTEFGVDAASVLEKQAPIEREVGSANGNWYLARMLPYRTLEDRIAGVVLSFINITDRKHAEQMRLWQSAVVSASADAIISFSLEGTIRSWNPGAERIFGRTAAEAVGQPLSVLARDQPSDWNLLVARIASAEPIDNHETVVWRKDGSELNVALTVSPIRDESGRVMAGTAIVRDITFAKRAEEAMRQSEERLRLVMDNAVEFAIFSMDLQRRITVWNAGAERLLGFSTEEIMGQPADIIFTPEDRERNVPQREGTTALADGRASDDRYHMRKDGSRFWASGVMMLMRDGKGDAVGFVKILRDQTAARQSREALERNRAELMRVLAENEKARIELEAADVAKDRFLAVLAHELRNPLASIASAAELLRAGVPSADSEAAAEVVRRQARGMKAMLDDLLDVSRLKLGRLELKRQQVRLSAVVASALEITRPLLADARHSLELDLGEHDVELDGDPLRLAQVVSNLLSNAIKYTPQNGTIALHAHLADDQLELSVKDTGIGMDPQRIPAMFEMFAQGNPGEDRSRGLGIGLALVKNIVELHGGQISARSDGPGKGSEFRVLLPGARSVARAPAASLPPAAPEPTLATENRGLVLIADDNADAGWGLAKLLETVGFETMQVTGGVDAVREIERLQPEAGVIDIGMPDLNGHEVVRQVRANPWGRKMVLIAVTGWGQEADQRQALDAGFDVHMTKPVDPLKLSETLVALLSSKA